MTIPNLIFFCLFSTLKSFFFFFLIFFFKLKTANTDSNAAQPQKAKKKLEKD